MQGEVEGVLDYQQNEGKFTSILMRPLMKIKIVDDSEWVDVQNLLKKIANG